MLMRQGEWWSNWGIKRKAMKLIWRKSTEEKERVEKNVIVEGRERERERNIDSFFFFFLFRDKYIIY